MVVADMKISRKKYFTAMRIFTALFIVGVAEVSFAQSAQQSYVVNELEVTIEGRVHPMQAREQAVAKATEQGFQVLLNRLTPEHTKSRHQEVINKTDMSRVLDRFNIIRETTDKDYKAVFNLRYKRDYIRNLFSRFALPFSEIGAGPVLLLPVMDLGDRQLLWEETNPWRAKLKEAAQGAGLVKFILPAGDPQEIMTLTPEMVAFGAGDMIMSVAKKYNAEAAVVARFQMGIAPDGSREALLDLTWYGEQNVPSKYLQIPLKSEQGLDMAMGTVAQQAIDTVQDAWRQLYMVDFDHPGQVLVYGAINTAEELQNIRQKFQDIPIVDSVLLRRVSANETVLQANYFGTVEKLKTLATENALNLIDWNQKLVLDLGDEQANADAYGVRAIERSQPMDQANIHPERIPQGFMSAPLNGVESEQFNGR